LKGTFTVSLDYSAGPFKIATKETSFEIK